MMATARVSFELSQHHLLILDVRSDCLLSVEMPLVPHLVLPRYLPQRRRHLRISAFEFAGLML